MDKGSVVQLPMEASGPSLAELVLDHNLKIREAQLASVQPPMQSFQNLSLHSDAHEDIFRPQTRRSFQTNSFPQEIQEVREKNLRTRLRATNDQLKKANTRIELLEVQVRNLEIEKTKLNCQLLFEKERFESEFRGQDQSAPVPEQTAAPAQTDLRISDAEKKAAALKRVFSGEIPTYQLSVPAYQLAPPAPPFQRPSSAPSYVLQQVPVIHDIAPTYNIRAIPHATQATSMSQLFIPAGRRRTNNPSPTTVSFPLGAPTGPRGGVGPSSYLMRCRKMQDRQPSRKQGIGEDQRDNWFGKEL